MKQRWQIRVFESTSTMSRGLLWVLHSKTFLGGSGSSISLVCSSVALTSVFAGSSISLVCSSVVLTSVFAGSSISLVCSSVALTSVFSGSAISLVCSSVG